MTSTNTQHLVGETPYQPDALPMVLLAAGVPLTLVIDLAFGPDSQFLLEGERPAAITAHPATVTERARVDIEIEIEVARRTPPDNKTTTPIVPGRQQVRLLGRLRRQRAAKYHPQMTPREVNGPRIVAALTPVSVSPDPVRLDLRPV